MKWFAIAGVLLMCGGATAAECMEGRGDVVALRDWAPVKKEMAMSARYGASVSVVSDLPKATRMVRGYVSFEDALGRKIIDFLLLPDDAEIPVGEDYQLGDLYGTSSDRIMTVDKADVVGIVCVMSAVYEDGEVVEF